MSESIYKLIIDCYYKHKDSNEFKEICKNKSIIKVMRNKEGLKAKTIKNALILILSLYDDNDDFYNTIGLDVRNITDENTKRAIKSELLRII